MKFFNFSKPFLFTLLITGTLTLQACDNSNETKTKPTAEPASTTQNDDPGDDKELKDAPDFSLKTMEGDTFTLSEHEGKVVILNIWATWCPPCRKEIPDFIELQNEMGDDGVLFVGVSVDKGGWSDVRPFAKEMEINYPLVVDDGTVNDKYGPFRGIPTTFIINKKGKVEYIAPGMVNKDMLQPVLEELAMQ